MADVKPVLCLHEPSPKPSIGDSYPHLSNDLNNNKNNSISMSNIIDDSLDDDEPDPLSSHQQTVKTKIIKCKTNSQQIPMNSYNILTSNGTSPNNLHSVENPNEYASIKLHIRRINSRSSTDLPSIPPMNNLLTPTGTELNEISSLPTKVLPRQFFNSNETLSPRSTSAVSRRLVSTRRTSLVETDSYHTSAAIYTLAKPLASNHTNIYDENMLSKTNHQQKTVGTKRKTINDQQDKKRTKTNGKTTSRKLPQKYS